MSNLRIVGIAGVVALATLAPSGARAQLSGSLVFTPYIGAYTPSADLGRVSGATSGISGDAWMKQQNAPAAGANLSYWMNERFAFETGLLYASSDLKQSTPGSTRGFAGPQLFSQHGNLWLASTKLMVQVLPPESAFNLRLGVGPALITRSGSAYSTAEGKYTGLTDIGAAMSLCTRFAMSPDLGLRVRVENFMYQANVGYESNLNPAYNMKFDSKLQNDVVFSAGLQFFVNR